MSVDSICFFICSRFKPQDMGTGVPDMLLEPQHGKTGKAAYFRVPTTSTLFQDSIPLDHFCGQCKCSVHWCESDHQEKHCVR